MLCWLQNVEQTSNRIRKLIVQATNRKLAFQRYYMFIQIVLKGKRGSQWFDQKQFVDANKIRDFFTMSSKLRIRFHELKMKW